MKTIVISIMPNNILKKQKLSKQIKLILALLSDITKLLLKLPNFYILLPNSKESIVFW